jgi:hypothetical protein
MAVAVEIPNGDTVGAATNLRTGYGPEGAVAIAEKNRDAVRPKIRNSQVRDAIAIEVARCDQLGLCANRRRRRGAQAESPAPLLSVAVPNEALPSDVSRKETLPEGAIGPWPVTFAVRV